MKATMKATMKTSMKTSMMDPTDNDGTDESVDEGVEADAVLADRIAGSIVGLAIGDALGYPHEFRTVAQVRREIGPAGLVDFVALKDRRFSRPIIVGTDHPPGTFTDDTQMSLAVAEALIVCGSEPDRDTQCLLLIWPDDEPNIECHDQSNPHTQANSDNTRLESQGQNQITLHPCHQ